MRNHWDLRSSRAQPNPGLASLGLGLAGNPGHLTVRGLRNPLRRLRNALLTLRRLRDPGRTLRTHDRRRGGHRRGLPTRGDGLRGDLRQADYLERQP